MSWFFLDFRFIESTKIKATLRHFSVFLIKSAFAAHRWLIRCVTICSFVFSMRNTILFDLWRQAKLLKNVPSPISEQLYRYYYWIFHLNEDTSTYLHGVIAFRSIIRIVFTLGLSFKFLHLHFSTIYRQTILKLSLRFKCFHYWSFFWILPIWHLWSLVFCLNRGVNRNELWEERRSTFSEILINYFMV